MKRINFILILLFVFSIQINAQIYTSVTHKIDSSTFLGGTFSDDYQVAEWSYYTPSRDSLFFLEGDTIALYTYEQWHKDPRWNKQNNPVIIIVSQEEMDRLKSRKQPIRRISN